MVLLSGKRKIKDPMQQKIRKQLFDPYFKQNYDKLHENMCCLHTRDPFYNQLIRMCEGIQKQQCNLSYQFKTIIQLNPEHSLYHLLFGKTKEYDDEKMQIIQDCLTKKYTVDKIKSIFTICPK